MKALVSGYEITAEHIKDAGEVVQYSCNGVSRRTEGTRWDSYEGDFFSFPNMALSPQA